VSKYPNSRLDSLSASIVTSVSLYKYSRFPVIVVCVERVMSKYALRENIFGGCGILLVEEKVTVTEELAWAVTFKKKDSE